MNINVDFSFIQGPVHIRTENEKSPKVGATAEFYGSIRADSIDNKVVIAIEFTAHKEIAEEACYSIMNSIALKYKLNSIIIKHSLGKVLAGQICFLVKVESAHRKAAFAALEEMVDEFKEKVPVFGKEIFENGSYTWKQNN